MPDQRNIAKSLIRGKLPTREIAGIIYDEADFEEPVAMQTPPPIENVVRSAKKSWVKAGTAVLSMVPEYTGDAVLRHKSKNLKNLYLEHGTDPKTLQSLHEHAEDSLFGLEQWAEKVELEWLENWARGASERVLHVLARRMMQAGKYEAVAKWRGRSETSRMSLIGSAVAYGIELNDIETTEKLLECLKSDKTRREATWLGWEISEGRVNETTLHVFRKYHTNRKEFLARLESLGSFSEPTSEENYIEFMRMAPVNEESGEPLVPLEVAMRYLRATLTHAGYRAIREIIDSLINEYEGSTMRQEAGEVLQRHAALEKSLEALGRFEPAEDGDLVSCLLGHYDEKLSDEAVYQALRFGSPEDTWGWLTDEVNRPTPEVFRRLLANPGKALPTDGDGQVDWAAFGSAMYAVDASKLLEIPFAEEILEAMGSRGTEIVLDEAEWESRTPGSPRVASDYLAARFTEHLGEDGEAWRAAMRILPTSTQSLGRTLRGVAKLYGAGRGQRSRA